MGGGCLSPKPRIGEIYIDVINLIHEQASRVTAEDPSLHDAVRQKIIKSGHLRKLMDYLVSHRTRIPDAMTHNCLLTNQTKSKPARLAGLIVCDRIMKSVCERQVEANKQFMIKSLKAINVSDGKAPKTETSEKEKEKEINVSLMGNSFGGEKNRLSECYFSTLQQFLKEEDPHLYLRVLKSLQKFSEYHLQDRSNSFMRNNPVHISQKCENILESLLKNISKQYQKEQTLKAYAGLIRTMKWYPSSFKDSDPLRYFLRLWIIERQNESLLMEECEIVLHEYIENYINSQHSPVIYEAVLELYDEFEFADIQFFEGLLLEILESLDLRSQFLRGLFIYLLGYVSWCKHPSLQARWNAIYPSIINEATRSRFPSLYIFNSKLCAIKTIRKWLDYQFVDIDEILTYSHSMFAQAYLFNVYEQLTRKAVRNSKEIMQEFRMITQGSLKVSSKVKIIQVFLEEINWIHAQEEYQTLLLDEALQIFKGIDYLDIYDELIQPITTNISPKNKIKVIDMNTEILKKIRPSDLSDFQLQEQIDTFLYSVYDHLCIQGLETSDKFNLIAKVQDFIGIIFLKQNKPIVYAYLEQVIKSQNQQESFKTRYILLYYSMVILEIFNPKAWKGIPDQVNSINLKIKQKSQISPQIQQEIQAFLKSHPMNAMKISEIHFDFSTDKENYEQNRTSFNALFRSNLELSHPSKTEENHISFGSDLSMTNRKNSTEYRDQFQDSESFRQILNIIRQ